MGNYDQQNQGYGSSAVPKQGGGGYGKQGGYLQGEQSQQGFSADRDTFPPQKKREQQERKPYITVKSLADLVEVLKPLAELEERGELGVGLSGYINKRREEYITSEKSPKYELALVLPDGRRVYNAAVGWDGDDGGVSKLSFVKRGPDRG